MVKEMIGCVLITLWVIAFTYACIRLVRSRRTAQPTLVELGLERDNPKRHDRFCMCWDCFEAEAIEEAMAEFDELFNSYEVKRAKNGALMIRQGDSGSYRFCKKA